MRKIRIRFSNKIGKYFFVCPFCLRSEYLGESNPELCEHVIYGYEDINQQVLGEYPDTWAMAMSLLSNKRYNFLKAFVEFWEEHCFDYCEQSEDDADTCPTFDFSEHREAINDFVESELTIRELIFLIRYSPYKGIIKQFVLAETAEDVSGWGKTYYLLSSTPINQLFKCQ